MSTKDFFSDQSKAYATFRPTYPEGLYEFVFHHLKNNDTAWDCATGNGQVAQYLSHHFKKIYATDISQHQLDNAFAAENIQYSISSAEKTHFPGHHFDLITVGQALHWFDQAAFYKEVERVGKPGSLLAVWGYGLLFIEPSIDDIIMQFYTDVVGQYWDQARRLVEQQYKTISFPFKEIPAPGFSIDVEWTLDHLSGYLESWSATQKFIKQNGLNPVPDVVKKIKEQWTPDEIKSVSFPVFIKMGRLPA